jgi:hypothetical protein
MMRMELSMNGGKRVATGSEGQAGAGVLPVVLMMGIVLLLIQGTTWYRSKSGTSFLGSEKSKVQAMQLAEAGVEENIADLANRTVKPIGGMSDSSTYNHKPLHGGDYSSRITSVAMGTKADTVDVTSTGKIGSVMQTIRARLRLNKYPDSTHAILTHVEPETTAVIATLTRPDTTSDSITLSSAAMPAFTSTPAYTACIASAATKCSVCHLLGGDVTSKTVLNVSKGLPLNSHNSHVGDYITTDATCDMYKPLVSQTITIHTELDTTYSIVDMNVYDTTVVIDTAVKVQVLSWR